MGLIPGSGRSGGGHGNPLQYSCLENPMGRGAWRLQFIELQRARHDWRDLARRHTLQLTAGSYRLIQSQRAKEQVWDSSSPSAWLYRGQFPLHWSRQDQNRKRTPDLVIFFNVFIFNSKLCWVFIAVPGFSLLAESMGLSPLVAENRL